MAFKIVAAWAAAQFALAFALEQAYQGKDKCMKGLWPDVVDPCTPSVGYHGSCQARVERFQSTYGGSCDNYCTSFGFKCVSGSKVAPLSLGCGATTSDSYFPCAEMHEGHESICTCTDTADTFLWSGVKKLCGTGKVLVDLSREERVAATALRGAPHATAAAPPVAPVTCAEFCGVQGMSCAEAEEAASLDTCAPKQQPIACDDAMPSQGAICKCAGSFDRTGSYKWPDKVEVCSTGTVLVAGGVLRERGGTCGNYCSSLRRRVPGLEHLVFSCYAALPSEGAGCSAERKPEVLVGAAGTANTTFLAQAEDLSDCWTDMQGKDAICSCSFLDL